MDKPKVYDFATGKLINNQCNIFEKDINVFDDKVAEKQKEGYELQVLNTSFKKTPYGPSRTFFAQLSLG